MYLWFRGGKSAYGSFNTIEELSVGLLCTLLLTLIYLSPSAVYSNSHGNIYVLCRPCSARVVSVRQMQGPGGIAQQTSYAIDQPGCPTQHLTRTIVVRPASRRPNDPNLPPSYDQAVTGADRSVRVDDSKKQPHINGAPSAPAPAPAADLPHMPPPRHGAAAPPAYQPTPSAPYLDNFHYSDRQRLLA